jgi:hypothetical protein
MRAIARGLVLAALSALAVLAPVLMPTLARAQDAAPGAVQPMPAPPPPVPAVAPPPEPATVTQVVTPPPGVAEGAALTGTPNPTAVGAGPSDEWRFGFHGFTRAPMRIGIGNRPQCP